MTPNQRKMTEQLAAGHPIINISNICPELVREAIENGKRESGATIDLRVFRLEDLFDKEKPYKANKDRTFVELITSVRTGIPAIIIASPYLIKKRCGNEMPAKFLEMLIHRKFQKLFLMIEDINLQDLEDSVGDIAKGILSPNDVKKYCYSTEDEEVEDGTWTRRRKQ